MDYSVIEKNKWKTSMFDFDCESCFLSCVVPCHVYSKIMSKTSLEYATRIILYIVLYTSLHQVIYIQYNLRSSKCPSIEVTNCFFSEICLNSYMIVDDMPYSCVNIDGGCIYGNYQCILNSNYNYISHISFLFSTILYISLTYIHYHTRMYILNKQNIHSSTCNDCFAITLGSSCGLGQEYRELEL